jgi:cyclic pyranopterin phosphate synthase
MLRHNGKLIVEMVDITHKNFSLRKAVAVAILHVSRQETMDAIRDGRVPKGNVYECARTAGLFAVKNTSSAIPDCHPIPVEYTAIRYQEQGLEIRIEVEVHTIYRTGVEVEAMHGAAITALTMYDMLKPIDKKVVIGQIALHSKSGGKSALPLPSDKEFRSQIVVCSDTLSKGEGTDTSGKAAIAALEAMHVTTQTYTVIPDDAEEIRKQLLLARQQEADLLLFIGGTGLSKRDITPDIVAPLLDVQIPGIMEAVRNYGQQRMPYAMLSRGVAGFAGDTLVITLPGSASAVREAIAALFPHLLHVFEVRQGKRHS